LSVSSTESGGRRGVADPIRDAIAQNRLLFATALGFSVAMNLLALAVPFYMLQVYDRVLSSRSEETLLVLSVIAVVAVLVFGALDALRLQLLMRAGLRVANTLGARVLRAMVATSAYHGSGFVRQGLRDVDTLRAFLGSPGFAAFFDVPFLFAFLAILYLLHPAFLAITVIGAAILVAIAVINQILSGRALDRSVAATISTHMFAEDGLRNADVLEGMGMSASFIARWRRLWLKSVEISQNSADRDSFMSGLSKAVRLLIQIALLGFGVLLVLELEATGGVMIAASILGARALAPIEAAVGSWKSFAGARLAWRRLTELLARAPKREEGMSLPAPNGRLSVVKATCVVPGERRTILSNISVDIAPGESLGIVGRSASGKSSLTRLLVGAWPCAAGAVRLDGGDIYSWPRQQLSKFIGYLPQDVELFGGTVRENIARLSDGEPETVAAAAKLAHAHEMILGLPKGYDTEIGEGGHKLSGGQRQRIGIARALYGNPRLVVLDEPNANLDGPGEDALLQTMVELKRRGVTVVIVSHRPSILAVVDKMLVLREGTVEMLGPQADVMKRLASARAAPPKNVVPISAGATAAAGQDENREGAGA
jgi:PrtD family type I secretion system ABC transporter